MLDVCATLEFVPDAHFTGRGCKNGLLMAFLRFVDRKQIKLCLSISSVALTKVGLHHRKFGVKSVFIKTRLKALFYIVFA